MLGEKKGIGCETTVKGSVQAVGGIDEPGIDVLAHGGQDEAKEPAFTASGAGLEKQKVVFFAFDRAFGAGASIEVCLPEVAFSGDESMQTVVLLGIGVEDAAIGRRRAVVGEVRAGVEVGCLLGSGQGAAPLDAPAVGTEAPQRHGEPCGTDGHTVVEA